MRVRLYELRLIAGFLLLLWALLFLAILVGYHPGGAGDWIVAGAILVPVAIAALAVRYPPLARGDRAAVLMGWLGIVACLLLIPVLAGVVEALAGPAGAAPLLPSWEAVYAGAVTLLATCLFAGLGLARRALGETALRRRRLLFGVGVGIALTVASGLVLGTAIVANGLVLRTERPVASAYGPVTAGMTPPRCDEPLAIGPSAVVHVDASATEDRRSRASLSLDGARAGSDEQWTATGVRDGVSTVRAYLRLASRTWARTGAGPWIAQPAAEGADGPPPTLDGALLAAALAPPQRAAAEDLGLEQVGGAPARHCRTLTTGPLALASVPELAWLAGTATPGPAPTLDEWRGQLDWWVFSDGQLGVARVRVSGVPPRGWPGGGVQGTLEASLTALSRTVAQSIGPAPLP